MAAKSFLGAQALNQLKAEVLNTNFLRDFEANASKLCFDISARLSEELVRTLEETPGFKEARPVITGSWARGELCLKSDIDLLLLGKEEAVARFTSSLFERGVKLRSRMPQVENRWMDGVEISDILSYLCARPMIDGLEIVSEQQAMILGIKDWKKQVVEFIKTESFERAKRYSSISNYLEPNIKYGPGGLRDCLQALQIMDLYKERFADSLIGKQLSHSKHILLLIRHIQHFAGGGDILTGGLQQDLYPLLSFENNKQFMKLIERTLFEVRLAMDFVLEVSQSSEQRLRKLNRVQLDTVPQALEALSVDPSMVLVDRIRNGSTKFKKMSAKSVGKALRQNLNWRMSEKQLLAIYRSGLLATIMPEFENVSGLVQHDQYHRYTVDAHLYVAMRECLRFFDKAQTLGEFGVVADEIFTNLDREVLFYTALFHDLGKGTHGDHSEVGRALAQSYLKIWGFPNYVVETVSWMVEKHLIMSQAAFRRNPESHETWQDLWSQGVKKKRIHLLGVFTAIDIRATNPEAWNQWKESLLTKLMAHLDSSIAKKLLRLISKASMAKFKWHGELLRQIDMELVQQLPEIHLVNDFKKLSKEKKLPALVISTRNGYWVRFQNPKDQKGLFLAYTQLLHGMGCSIEEAYVETLPRIGVYDWFKVKSAKSLATLRKQIRLLKAKEPEVLTVPFDSIEITGRDEKGVYIAFRGKDVRGALVCAAKSLSNQNLTIKWARVHTWGQQLDDIFCVEADDEIQKKVLMIREALVKKQGGYQSDPKSVT